MKYHPCVRCGMCCIVTPCTFSGVEDNEDCPYLTVNDDFTTTCHNQLATKTFVDNGIGCIFQNPEAKEILDLHIEMYNVTERKQQLKEAQHE